MSPRCHRSTYIRRSRLELTLQLTAKQEANLKQCRADIEAVIKTCTDVRCRQTDDLSAWPQELVVKFYHDCLSRQVWPTIDFEQRKLTLAGKKDSVDAADKSFLELTNQALKQAHLKSMSQHVLWQYQVDPTTWLSYSYKCVAELEYAHSVKKLPTVRLPRR